jgi:CubicO group peptidase (beta-lactamase class C family)
MLLVALSCSSAPAAFAQEASFPQTKAGMLIRDWMNLCQAPDLGQMTKWMATNISEAAAKRVPAQERAESHFAFCSSNGGFHIANVAVSEPDLVITAIGLKSGIWYKIQYAVNATGQFDGGSENPMIPPESALPKDLSDTNIAVEIKRRVDKLSTAGLFSGFVTLARGTKIVVSANAGYADRSKKSTMSGSTQFTLGSMGKMFTATAIGQLVDQKKASFDDTVGKFFPDYPNSTVRDKVTVGMLLSHTAGLGDFLGKRTSEMMKNGVKRAADFLPLFDKDEPQFAPGTSWSYSNSGLVLAGAIVEVVSGEAYPDYIRKHIFALAGMANSDPNNIPRARERLVTPYTKMTEHGRSPDWREAEHDIGSPAGGAISTADDLVRFADALRSGKLVSAATFREMCKSRGGPPGYKYGYGMEVGETYGRTTVGHGGGFPGVSTHLYMLLDSPYTLVILSNQDPPSADLVGTDAIALVVEKAKLE